MADILLTTRQDLQALFTDVFGQITTHELKDSKQMEEIFLTKKEASDFLKVSPNTIDNYRKRNLIKSYKIGNNVRFKRSELMEAVEGKLSISKTVSK